MPYRIKSPVTNRQIGRRGVCLFVFGFVPFMVGLALCVTPNDRSGQDRTIPVLAHLAPGAFWSWAWMLLGLLVMMSAFGGWQFMRYGYVIAYGLPTFWGAAYVLSWAFGLLATGWISAVVYFGYAMLVTTIAGWDEPSVLERINPPGNDRRDDDA